MRAIHPMPRIFLNRLDTDRKRDDVVAWCRELEIDEVQVVPAFYGTEPGFPPPERMPARAEFLKDLVADLKDRGIRTRFNASWFVYRSKYESRDPDAGAFRARGMKDVTGRVAPDYACLLDPGLREYGRKYYAMLAQARPTCMMITDNFRYGYHGGGTYCFCDLHIDAFNAATGASETFDSIREACQARGMNELKTAYMRFKKQTLVDTAEWIRTCVHEVAPEVRVGLNVTFSGIAAADLRDVRELVDAFAGGHRPVARTSFGWYTDADRREFLYGLADVLFQKSRLRPDTEIEAEIDWFPHTPWCMSSRVVFGAKTRVHVLAGIRGLSLYAFPFIGAPVNPEHESVPVLRRALHAHEGLAQSIPDEAKLVGAGVKFNEGMGLLRRQSETAWYGSRAAPVLWRLGLPATFTESPVTVLTGESAPLEREDAEAILAGGSALLDADAVAHFADLGMGARLGATLGERLAHGAAVHERPCAGSLAQDLPPGGTPTLGRWNVKRALFCAADDLHAETTFHNLAGEQVSDGVLAGTRMGRRLVLLPYALTERPFILNRMRQTLVRNLLTWLYDDALPAWTEGADLVPLVTDCAPGGGSFSRLASVVNVGLEPSTGRSLHLRVPARGALRVSRYDEDDEWCDLDEGRHYHRHGADLTLSLSGELAVGPLEVGTCRVQAEAGGSG